MKKILYFLLLSSQVYAQAPTKLWDKTIGGNNYDYASSIIGTSDGGFVIAGYSASDVSGDKSEVSQGSFDYWIVKLNSLGQKVWDKTLGGSGVDYGYSIIATSDGGFVIAGQSNSDISGDKSETSRGGSDQWIVKLNSTGQKVWDKTIGGLNTDIAKSIVTTSDGGFIIAGYSNSDISGDKSEVSRGGSDYWIVKLNNIGQKMWDKTIAGFGNEKSYSIVETSDGSFVIAGSSDSDIFGDKSEASRGNLDYWIVKLNSTGQKIWDKTIGGSSSDEPNLMIGTSDGGFVIAGYSYSGISGEKSETSRGGSDQWIVKLNSTGQKVWDKTIGGSNYDILTSIIATSDGGYMVAGTSLSGISGDKSEANIGIKDYWILKLNSAGQKVWDKTLGGASDDIAYSMIITSDGGLVIAGESDSVISGDKTEANKGGSDFWIVKLGGDLSNQIFESISTGYWNQGSTWIAPTNILLPTATKTVKINALHTVSIPNTPNEVKTIQMNGGTINLIGGTLEIKNQ